MGATVAIYGPTIPAFRSTFHITAAAAGLLLSGHFVGSLAGTLSPSVLPGRLRSPRLVAGASVVCFALGCLAIAAAPTWPGAVAGAVVEGAGWGGLVIVFNSLFSSGFGPRSPAMLTLLNAVYGIGAIIGPVMAGLLAAGHFRGPFLTAGIAALVLLPLTVALPRTELPRIPHVGAQALSATRLPLVLVAFMAALFLYGGLEAGIGAWMATHLIATGLSVAAAATATSLFWAAYTTGRLMAASLSVVVTPPQLVIACVGAVSVLVLLARIGPAAPVVYTVCGLLVGPIFPMSLAWSARVFHASQRITALIISGDLLGGVLLSFLLGRLITATAPDAVPFAFAAMAAGMFCIFATLQITLSARPSPVT
jgi:fucose permease